MKTYKDLNNDLWAYEADGSQDHLIPDNFILVTEEEADAIRKEKAAEFASRNPIVQPSKEQLLAELQKLTAKIEALS
jgi:hypothetical protein